MSRESNAKLPGSGQSRSDRTETPTQVLTAPGAFEPRATCLACHRPRCACVCQSIERANNRTQVYVLQHPRESRHPIGTVRIARAGLERFELHVAGHYDRRGVECTFPVAPGTAVLYPGAGARELAEVVADPDCPTPTGLIVLDATWSCAKALWRENPWLHDLPRVSLRPTKPGNYRIRKEPAPHCLSTIEAIVAALQILEPQTPHLDGLLTGFTRMVDRHIELRRADQDVGDGTRTLRTRVRARPREPSPIVATAPNKLILVYCEGRAPLQSETSPGRSVRGHDRPLLRICGLKVASGEWFDAILAPAVRELGPADREQLAVNMHHAGLTMLALDGAMTTIELQKKWSAFVGDDDLLLAWNSRNFELYREYFSPEQPVLGLKGLYRRTRGAIASGCLDTILAGEGLEIPIDVAGQPTPPGRAARRLLAAHTMLALIRTRA